MVIRWFLNDYRQLLDECLLLGTARPNRYIFQRSFQEGLEADMDPFCENIAFFCEKPRRTSFSFVRETEADLTGQGQGPESRRIFWRPAASSLRPAASQSVSAMSPKVSAVVWLLPDRPSLSPRRRLADIVTPAGVGSRSRSGCPPPCRPPARPAPR